MAVRFEIIEGQDAGREFDYPANTHFVVGRDVAKRSGLKVPTDPYMSRHHFLVVVGVDDCLVRDCGSSNGLFVNDRRVKEVEIASGDRIRAGRTQIIVHIEQPVEGPPIEPGDDPVRARFQLLDRLTGAGAARVFKARDRETQELVALKFTRTDFTDAARRMPMFRRELEAATTLRHDHIVPLVGAGLTAQEAWLASRWIDGPTLQKHVKQETPIARREGLQLAVDLLSAVEHAHRHGFVHRDIKPANVLLERTPSGHRTMLADFGLAKRLDGHDVALTSTGALRGTPRYMSPEQVRDSRSAGPKSDQFAAAATIYFALTGAWHYDKGHGPVWETLLRGTPVPIREHRADLGPDIERVLMRALRSEQTRRYPTVEAFRAEMDSLVERRPGDTQEDAEVLDSDRPNEGG